MKPYFKRKVKVAALVTIAILCMVKLFFEIDNRLYEAKIERMRGENKLTVAVKSPIEHKTISTSDFRIHYYVSGAENQTAILLLHQAFSDHRAFDQQIDFFSKDYKVITIDLIGHGFSKANKSKDKIDASPEHIAKVLELEGVNKSHVVGVSLGSLIAQYFALGYPEKVMSLTSLGGYDINKENTEVTRAQRAINLGLIGRALFSLKSFGKKSAELTCISEKGRALFYETTSHFERKSFMVMQGLQSVIKERENIRPTYPTLIVTGEFDVELAKTMAKEWHKDLSNSSYGMIENAGHCANIDKPVEFNELLQEFIKQTQ